MTPSCGRDFSARIHLMPRDPRPKEARRKELGIQSRHFKLWRQSAEVHKPTMVDRAKNCYQGAKETEMGKTWLFLGIFGYF